MISLEPKAAGIKCIKALSENKSAETKKAGTFERSVRETNCPKAIRDEKTQHMPQKPVKTRVGSTVPKKEAANGIAADTSKNNEKKASAESHLENTRSKKETGSTSEKSQSLHEPIVKAGIHKIDKKGMGEKKERTSVEAKAGIKKRCSIKKLTKQNSTKKIPLIYKAGFNAKENKSRCKRRKKVLLRTKINSPYLLCAKKLFPDRLLPLERTAVPQFLRRQDVLCAR